MNFTYAIKRYENIPCNFIVVGVSSGPDSMALLHMLQKNLKKEIICAHINHNVRKESEEEEAYLKEYCIINKIIFETNKITSYSQNNFENEAREKRYAFYKKVLKKYNTNYLFLAHHGDDLIETVLMKISRGSNIEGYAGIKEESIVDNIHIIRPLLYFTKEELVKYNQINNIKYFIDKTNEDVNYKRNKYRKKILPILKEEDKNVHMHFLKFSKLLFEYDNYVEKETQNKLKKVYANNKLNIEEYKKLENLIKYKVICKILEDFYQDDLMLINDSHVALIESLINCKKSNSYVYLPNDVIAIKSYYELTVKKNTDDLYEYEIEFDKYAGLPNGHTIEKIDSIDSNDNNICRIDKTEVAFPLHIRTRKAGDKMKLKKLNGSKKVNHMLKSPQRTAHFM